ncbi:MAG: lysine biosynthesis protein LysX [Thaumarchaeota archaeon]|nr:lysine biosynthesis protein LysX [Nitrososphaerota archaeon]
MSDICIVYDRVRWEEKCLCEKAIKLGHTSKMIDAKTLAISTFDGNTSHNFGDIVLQRCISHYRGLYLTACLEFLGSNVINAYSTAEICGNKLLTSVYLSRHRIPTPVTQFAFGPDVAGEVGDEMGYPLVLKPIVGSWGRMIIPIKDKDVMDSIIEMREEMSNPLNKIYYLQDYVNRPPRDIRTIVVDDRVVTAIYRYSPEGEWRTNISRGGKAELCPITNELEDICMKTSKAVGSGILGIDLMEDKEKGLVVHEVNNTVEFKGASTVSEKDIAAEIVNYASKMAM